MQCALASYWLTYAEIVPTRARISQFWSNFTRSDAPEVLAQNTSNAGDTSKRLEEESKKAEADIKAGVSKNKQQVSSCSFDGDTIRCPTTSF